MIARDEIEKRWNTRIVPNHLDNPDGSGVQFYLSKWGKNISDEKLEALADYAREKELPVVAEEFLANTSYGWFKRSGDNFIPGFRKDFARFYLHNFSMESDDFSLFSGDVRVGFFNSIVDFEGTRKRIKQKVKGKGIDEVQFAFVQYELTSGNYIIVENPNLGYDVLKFFNVEPFYITGEPIFLDRIPTEYLSVVFDR